MNRLIWKNLLSNPKGSLRSKGLIRYVGSRLELTDAGRSLASAPDKPLTTDELHESILSRLPTPEQRVLKPILAAYPDAISADSVAQIAGYAPGAGSFNNPKGRLRTLGLIDYPSGGMCKASDFLFLP